MKKQKTDWVKELKEKFGCYPECGCDLLPCIERKELVEFISQLLKTQREQLKKEHKENISLIREKFRQYGIKTGRQQLISEIEGIVGEDEKIELEQPKLFQPNPEPNEYGGYSSVPFYCSLCGESEMTIQDNEVNGKYHCKCSWWTNSCGGKWIKWYDKDYAEKAILDIPSEDNFRNQLRKEIRERLKQITNLKEK